MLLFKKKISSIERKHSIEEARKRSRILVIDDDPSAFPTSLLTDEGYNVHYWENVKSLSQLENGEFDIIVLDIHGIATKEQSADGGIGILSHIKRYNPTQIVVAYSGKKYDLKEEEFWKLADDYLGKPSTLIACKQKIDELLQTKYSVTNYWNSLKAALERSDIPDSKIRKIEHEIVKSVNQRKALTVGSIMEKLKVTKEIAGIVAIAVNVILRICAVN